MKIEEFEVEVLRKKIKNLHLRIYPPDARIVVSVPQRLSDREIFNFLQSRIDWIRIKHQEVKDFVGKSSKEFESGEIHYFLGKQLKLEVHPLVNNPKIEISPDSIHLFISQKADKAKRASIIFNLYKREVTGVIENLMLKWCEIMGEPYHSIKWEVKRIKKKWGVCYPFQRRIVFNLFLARVPISCIEMVVVHELTHLKVRPHNKEFYSTLSRYLPDWKDRSLRLNSIPPLLLP